MNLQVTRRWFTPYSTCGMLDIDGVFYCYTVERQIFKAGMVKPYAIPVGAYDVILGESLHFGFTVPHLQDVAGFDEIEIHPANFPSDLKGCTGVGSEHHENYTDPKTGRPGGAVFGSRVCFAELMEKLRSADRISISYTEEPVQ